MDSSFVFNRGRRRGDSLWWTIRGGFAWKGYLLQALGISKGRDFTSSSIEKGREICHLGLWKGRKGLTGEFYGLIKLRNLSSWHMRGFVGSMVMGITKWGGDTSPTFPQTDKDPLATRSRIVLEINSEKARKLLLLGKNARGGWWAAINLTLKWTLKFNEKFCCIHTKLQETKEGWSDRGIMENPGPHRPIMMDETRDKKWGVAKTEKTWRGMDLPRGHHLKRREWTGPVGGLPFPVTPHRSWLNRFLGLFQLKVKRKGWRLERAKKLKKLPRR